MRVLLIGHSYVWAENHRKLEELCRCDQGLELFLLVPSNLWPHPLKGSRRLEITHSPNYHVIADRVVFSGFYWRYMFLNPTLHLKSIQPDIIHVEQEPTSLIFAQVFLARELLAPRAKVVFFTWQNLDCSYRIPFRWVEACVLRRADQAIAGNNEAVAVLRGKGYRGPVAVIPQVGVSPEFFCDDPSCRRNNKRFVIGYVGRLDRAKGVDTLLEAVAGLSGEWQLRLVGAGRDRQQVQLLAAQLGISERVKFVPPVLSSTEMPDVYRGLDVLVLPSRTVPGWKEQFGRVLVEAMACEVPVIGSMSGSIPDVIGDAGLLFPEGDVEALRSQLVLLREDSVLRADLAKRGRERVLVRYTQARVASAVYQVYCNVLSQPLRTATMQA